MRLCIIPIDSDGRAHQVIVHSGTGHRRTEQGQLLQSGGDAPPHGTQVACMDQRGGRPSPASGSSGGAGGAGGADCSDC